MAVDVAGFGGTNWARIEAARRDHDMNLFIPFLDWGIPTLDCLLSLRQSFSDQNIIASGGVRHGLDAMRAYWLGANTISLAGPLLAQLLRHNKTPSPDSLSCLVKQLQRQMELTLFLTGAPDLASFRGKEALIDNELI